MSAQTEGDRPTVRRARPWAIRRWSLWEVPHRLAISVLLVETTTIGLVVVVAVRMPVPDVIQLLQTALLAGLGLLHTEISIGIERIRRRVTVGNHANLSSVWTFAGALVLPPVCAAAVAVVVHLHVWARTGRPRVPLYRSVYSAATIVLACLGAAAVIELLGHAPASPSAAGLLGIVLAMLVYTTVNTGLVAGAIAMSAPQPDLTRVLGRWDDNLLEIATLSLGALTAVALVVNPWLVAVRAATAAGAAPGRAGAPPGGGREHRQQDRAAQRRGVARAGRAGAGPRQQGRRSPRACSCSTWTTSSRSTTRTATSRATRCWPPWPHALRAEVRDRDLVGRFGGEEFVVLLAGPAGSAGRAELDAVAERIRRRVADLQVEIPTPDGPLTVAGLTVSIGGAVHSRPGSDLRTLLQIADTALYSAKRAGRNQSCGWADAPAPAPYARRVPSPSDWRPPARRQRWVAHYGE